MFPGRIVLLWGIGGMAACTSCTSPEPRSPTAELRIEQPSPGPDMPEHVKRPPLICFYRTNRSHECFETREEACSSIDCPINECGVPYGYRYDPPGGPVTLSCN